MRMSAVRFDKLIEQLRELVMEAWTTFDLSTSLRTA